jgi:hypothetical protein
MGVDLVGVSGASNSLYIKPLFLNGHLMRRFVIPLFFINVKNLFRGGMLFWAENLSMQRIV